MCGILRTPIIITADVNGAGLVPALAQHWSNCGDPAAAALDNVVADMLQDPQATPEHTAGN